MSNHARLHLADAADTAALAAWIGRRLKPGDTVLLYGNLGAGKTHFARSAIQARLADAGFFEDVPSPTFTLVQVYEDRVSEIWHCDLYRLSNPDETEELGLLDAMDAAICFVEWPERLQDLAPEHALSVSLSSVEDENARNIEVSAHHPKWQPLFAELHRYADA